ncbi:hypothetical protein [Pseudonocardia xishanensis]|uniref:Tryptophan-associated transmembrane protein n=1 Tax=Pseudonocardia xishanensis TaxID=630995 RepID=A0ABP8RCG1_9PSEU
MSGSAGLSGVGRIVVRRARLLAVVPLLLPLVAWLILPVPSPLDDGWWQALPDRYESLPSDVLLGDALALGLVTTVASIGFRAKGFVRLLAVVVVGSTVVAVARALQGGLCGAGDCLDSVAALGGVLIAWLVAVAAAVTAWMATLSFDGARRAT